jgi:hypothetical protein
MAAFSADDTAASIAKTQVTVNLAFSVIWCLRQNAMWRYAAL